MFTTRDRSSNLAKRVASPPISTSRAEAVHRWWGGGLPRRAATRCQAGVPSGRILAVAMALLLSGCLPSRPDFMIRTERAVMPLVDGSRSEIATRVAELEQETAQGALRGGDLKTARADLTVLRDRLETGDFRVGDQVVVTVSHDVVLVDTATVREGMLLAFAALPDVSVAGLLRTELQPKLQAHVDRYRKEHTVRVNLLTRLQVVGQVARPGYYGISPDRPVSEIIMLAGGPNAAGNLDKVTIRRNRKLIVKGSQWREAVNAGMTVAQLGLQPGDEVEIGGRQQRGLFEITRNIAFMASGVFAIIRILQFIYQEPE
jgi:protein involved in polysaccharide export with SLBB domain